GWWCWWLPCSPSYDAFRTSKRESLTGGQVACQFDTRLMARTSTYHAYDRLLEGRLGPLLLDAKRDGRSVEDIAFELRAEHEIRVSVATIYRWLSIAESEASLV